MDENKKSSGIVDFIVKNKPVLETIATIIGIIVGIITLYNIVFPKPKFILYENADYGIKINRHQNWFVQENESGIRGARFIEVKFKKQSKSDICPIEMTVHVDDLQDSTFSLEEYKNLIISRIKNNYSGSKIKDESNFSTTLSNHPAYKLIYRKQEKQCSSRVMELGTVWKNKAYYVVYLAKDDKYFQFLSTVEKMIQSFQFTDNN